MSLVRTSGGSKNTAMDALEAELARRMARPQRHRLLQGYPMAPLHTRVRGPFDPFGRIDLDPTRPLIIGVLPHTFCNPKVKGCGFCTFPHESLANESLRRVVERVGAEIQEVGRRQPSLRTRSIEAVYFGGGTANLMPPEALTQLVGVLASTFDLSRAELTLEGVPKYFLVREQAMLDALGQTPVRHRRISMGVQTFDPLWLARMGRDAFGDRDELARLVAAAHTRGFTVSADLLFNLPGESTEHALSDIRAAIELGFDQVCVYNLVLTADLGTEWSRETSLVKAMPAGAECLSTWLNIRDLLLGHGYIQTTLTNFERVEVAQSPKHFVYELASFDPATRDALGFGPGAISTFTSGKDLRAIKWVNVGTSDAFSLAMREKKTAFATCFEYGAEDLRLLHLTRTLARLRIAPAEYQGFFGTTPLMDFPGHFPVLEAAGLVQNDRDLIRPTPKGMFYADAIAGLLAHERTDELSALQHHMG